MVYATKVLATHFQNAPAQAVALVLSAVHEYRRCKNCDYGENSEADEIVRRCEEERA